MFDVDFEEEFKIVVHPSQRELAERLRSELSAVDFTKHFAIFSSGTTSREMKGYVLSEKAMEANARAVNEWFGLTSKDIWGLSLPVYHVGGLSVLVRARLLGNKVIDLRGWDPQSWYLKVRSEKVTVTTLVPTQLYDLVRENLSAPAKLRYTIVGGDFLPEALEKKARDLGWPIIRTYGMTEVCSQLASGRMPGDKLQVLPIHEVQTNSSGILQVKSPALFDATFYLGEKFQLRMVEDFLDEDEYYTTQDRAWLSGDIITPLGRENQEIKVSGHLTSLLTLKETLSAFLVDRNLYGKAELIAEDDTRKGKRLVLIHQNLPDDVLKGIITMLRPITLDEMRAVEKFKRTELGKLKT